MIYLSRNCSRGNISSINSNFNGRRQSLLLRQILARTLTGSSSTSSSSSLRTSSSRTTSTISDDTAARHSVVIGGGFVGLSTALHLQAIGRRVTLVESSSEIGGGASCSYGNAGTMAVYANVPINSPSLFRKLPKLLLGDFWKKINIFTNSSTNSSSTNSTSSPLSITASWQHLPKMIPWAALFAWNCRPSAVEHTAASLGALLSRAESGWEIVWQQSGIDIINGTIGDNTRTHHVATNTTSASILQQQQQPWRVKEGYLILQRTPTDMESSQFGANLRRRFIIDPDQQKSKSMLKMHALKSSDEVLQLEPHLDPHRCEGGAWYFPEAWSLTDPGALLKGLARGLENGGGIVRKGSAVVEIHQSSESTCRRDVESNNKNNNNNATLRVLLDDGTHISADEIVIAAGAHSASLVSSSMGEFCPLETERGYSITFEKPPLKSSSSSSSPLLTRAVCDPTAGWIATPMAGRELRVAGKVELGGVDAPPTPARFNELEREARSLFGGNGGGDNDNGNDNGNVSDSNNRNTVLLGRRIKEKDWMGFRPTMPDALPVIGRSRKLPNSVFYAFGHHHVGWTLGGITGQLVAEMVQGKEPSVDLTPYSLDRFRFKNLMTATTKIMTTTDGKRRRNFSSSSSSKNKNHNNNGFLWARPNQNLSQSSSVAGLQQRDFSSSSYSPSATSQEKLRPLPDKMQHVSYIPGCSPSELSITYSPLPTVTPNDVLIQVEYSGVGGTDLAQRRGNFNPKQDSPDHHLIMGLEVSGIVAQVGDDVTGFRQGDRVMALLYGGGYAQYALAPQQQVLEVPDTLTLEQGAAIPENFWTVYANLFEPAFGNLCEKPEEKTLLVHGGTGGIGSTALLLSKALGVRQIITTVSSPEKMEAAKRFGADVAINYNETDFVEKAMEATQGKGVDVILCFLGGDYTPRNIDAMAPFGRLVQLGLRRGKDVTFDFKVLMNKWGLVTGGHLRPRTLEQKEATRNALRDLVLPLWKSGGLEKPEVMKVLRLEEAGEAHRMLEKGVVVGKVVLKP